ncbi:orotidine 5'-phosphate decarboxylase [alpha proteobacterium AAP81b]|nr:orotidine 5'-phosphate decarboxylase [alpha proteobacterium AAP81b]
MTANPVFVALDTAHLGTALALAAAVRPHVGGVKLGLEFFMAQGPAGVRAVVATGTPVFLDVKLHDIGNTMAGAMRSLAGLGAAIVNVHATAGVAAMAAVRAAAPPETAVIAVTVLTSFDAGDLAAIGVATPVPAQVAHLAALTRDAGLQGVVCSGAEIAAIRAAWPEALIVVPGVRPEGSALGDQKRVMTPRAAVDLGASVLVIGRPITAAHDPAAAAAAIAASLG